MFHDDKVLAKLAKCSHLRIIVVLQCLDMFDIASLLENQVFNLTRGRILNWIKIVNTVNHLWDLISLNSFWWLSFYLLIERNGKSPKWKRDIEKREGAISIGRKNEGKLFVSF